MYRSSKYLAMVLFGTAAVVAVLYFEVISRASVQHSVWVVGYGIYISLTVLAARLFASWYGHGSDRWVALSLVPMAIVGVTTIVTSLLLVVAGLILTPPGHDMFGALPTWEPFAAGVLGAIAFVRLAWPALALGHFVAALLAWKQNAASMTGRGDR